MLPSSPSTLMIITSMRSPTLSCSVPSPRRASSFGGIRPSDLAPTSTRTPSLSTRTTVPLTICRSCRVVIAAPRAFPLLREWSGTARQAGFGHSNAPVIEGDAAGPADAVADDRIGRLFEPVVGEGQAGGGGGADRPVGGDTPGPAGRPPPRRSGGTLRHRFPPAAGCSA